MIYTRNVQHKKSRIIKPLIFKNSVNLLAIRTLSYILLLAGALSCTPLVPQRPNIILIMADDMGWSDPGYMGNPFHETPHLDMLSRQGMVFRQAYANAPNCAPTRASLISGQYTPRHGIYTVGSSSRGAEANRKLIPIPNRTNLDGRVYTIAEALKTAGYVNAHIGKWHLGENANTNPLSQGFDVNIGGNLSGHPDSYFSPYHNPNITDGPKGEHLTDRLTQEAIDFISTHQNQPFYLNLWYYAVHTPIQSKDSLIQKYTSKSEKGVDRERYDPVYAAMIEVMDQGIGRIVATLDSLGLTENTLIIFLSDNGPYFPVSSAEPLRGSKGMLYEGGIRIPMVVKWPGKVAEQSTCQIPVITMDLYPTLLEAASVSPAPNHELDGVSLMPVLTQSADTLADREFYWHFPAYLQGYKGMKENWRQTPASAILDDGWKLIESFEDSTLELYHLREDLDESQNVAETNPEKVDELYSKLDAWRKRLNAPVPTQVNEAYNPNFSNNSQ